MKVCIKRFLDENIFLSKHVFSATNSGTAPIKVELFELIEFEEVIIISFLFISLLVCNKTVFHSPAYKTNLLPLTNNQLCRPSQRWCADCQKVSQAKTKHGEGENYFESTAAKVLPKRILSSCWNVSCKKWTNRNEEENTGYWNQNALRWIFIFNIRTLWMKHMYVYILIVKQLWICY